MDNLKKAEQQTEKNQVFLFHIVRICNEIKDIDTLVTQIHSNFIWSK